MKHIYSNTKDGQVRVDKIEQDMNLFQSAFLSKQKHRSVNRFIMTLGIALLILLFAIAVGA